MGRSLVKVVPRFLPFAVMSEKAVYLTSDIHLGVISPERAQAFFRWLEHVGDRASELIINGDLFDFWFEYRSVIPRGHTRILGALSSLVDGGVPVTMLGGNHDWWGGSFLREEVGVSFHRKPLLREIAGRKALIAHGDGLGRGDLGYRMLRGVLRGRATRWTFRWLHPDLGALLAKRVSKTGRRAGGPTEEERIRAVSLEKWAVRRMAEDETLDMVILGHTHLPAVREVEPGRFYLNAGDWVRHRSYAVLEEGAPPRLEHWPK